MLTKAQESNIEALYMKPDDMILLEMLNDAKDVATIKKIAYASLINTIACSVGSKKKAHVRRELIESLDEQDRTTIQDAITQLLHPQPIGAAGYLAHLNEILLTLGHQGDVVIVGRGAQYILPSQFGLRVRMIAPVEQRVRRIANRENLSLVAARDSVEKADHTRTNYVHRQFGKNTGDPLNHDVTINTAELTVEAAADVVMTALDRKLAVRPGNGA